MGDWHGKHFFAAAVALGVGLVLGGLGPRSEIRSLQDQLATSGDHPRERDVGRKIFGEVFRPRTAAPETPDAAPEPADEPQPAPIDPDPPLRGPRGAPSPDDAPDGVPEPGGRADGVQQMKDALDLRRIQAQAALREQADASDEQMDQVDQIVAGMNADLDALATDFVATVGQGDPSRHDLMVFASDTLDVLLSTEESLGGVLDEEQLQQLTADALDPTAYVDGTVVDVLSGLDRR